MKNFPIPRLDKNADLRNYLLKYCRFKEGYVWIDPLGKHKIGCLDASVRKDVQSLMQNERTVLAIHDPPYNIVAFEEIELRNYIDWCRKWIDNTYLFLSDNSSLYVWLGADQKNGFQPLPDFMVMMRSTPFHTRSFITMRNQRGYGTLRNWMTVRQELLYYMKGSPVFNVEAEYTEIPKILRGYYKKVGDRITENLDRSRSENIRAGNVWIDIQQVFYRMEENVNGCYAQKPLKAIERIISASSNSGDLIIDFFCHSGTTLIASELLNRRCFTLDKDPIYCEIALRRLERFRSNQKTGWQNSNPFEQEIQNDPELKPWIQKYNKIQEKTVL
jgi:site-specific DNA-methyltransferase (adenine-specific)